MRSLLPDDRISRWLTHATDVTVIACGWWLIALSVITCIEMMARKLFAFSLQGVDEIGSYTYGIVAAFGFSCALITRSHTRVDFLLSRFPARVRTALNLLAMLSLAALAVLCVWRGWHVLQESIDLGSRAPTPLATPMWIPQTIWLGGYLMFAFVALWAAADALKLLVRGQAAEIEVRFGPQTLQEEIEAETDLQLRSGPNETAAPAAAPANAAGVAP
ncbi:MAG TPA: TRAP transporter small permease [Burkholderiaceae bacterium]|nr:TRAP transporter small permease [Burkholderiaceae bacterium]